MNATYKAYLASPGWHEKRDAKLEAEDWQCERCGQFGKRRRNGRVVGLHVHHLTYERIGNELMEDLEVLCIYCHEVEHGLNKRTREQIAVRLAVGVYEWNDEYLEGIEPVWSEVA